MAIIGVVAAMTIPNLMANNAKTEQVVALKSVHSDISQALKLMMVDEGVSKVSDTNILTNDGVENWTVTQQRVGDEFLKKYFKVVKDCGYGVGKVDCWPTLSTIKNINGDSRPDSPNGYCVIVASGSSICMYQAGTNAAGSVSIDTNGPKKPNVLGRDMFTFSFYYDGTLDDTANPECRKGVQNVSGNLCYDQSLGAHANAQALREHKYQNMCKTGYYGEGCFAKILNDGWKMDY